LDLGELVNAIRIVELSAKSRPAAIRALVQAANLEDDNVSADKILEAIEEREAAAQTLVAPDFALPHAFVDWEGDLRIVLGRSKTGVEYGLPAGQQVRLICLLVIGRKLQQTHVDVLAALAELLKTSEFRQSLIEAKDTKAIDALLLQKAGVNADHRPQRAPALPKLTTTLIRQSIDLVDEVNAQALLIAIDRVENFPWELMQGWQGKLLVVTTSHTEDYVVPRQNTYVFDVVHASLSRMDRANLGLLLAASEGLLNDKMSVVCVTGPDGRKLDSLSVTKPEAHFRAMLSEKTRRGRGITRPAVLLRVLSLALEIATEGREAHPVGAMFVLGDTRSVLRQAQQLVLNPFHGYSRQLRNVLDPSLAETIKEFALIDGAFIIQGDGTVLSAGTYLMPKTAPTAHLPAGLGARHQTAAAITAHTLATTITVSQSTGTVTVFRNGSIVFSLERGGATRW
jgi:DNA integrity scanning protein DisA with diadenylate cyclase activity/mannitol/fructose-specific phosphotransferase system IIA component (Ntr-type)